MSSENQRREQAQQLLRALGGIDDRFLLEAMKPEEAEVLSGQADTAGRTDVTGQSGIAGQPVETGQSGAAGRTDVTGQPEETSGRTGSGMSCTTSTSVLRGQLL